jgi:flagellar L-ring protein precursor FlgH
MKRLLIAALAALSLASATQAQATRPGSIYQVTSGPRSMIADKTARRPGDLITVLITENQELKNQETSQMKRESSFDAALTTFDIAPNAFSPLPNVGADATDDFTGRANYEKKGEFTARITAIVMDVLPNGNLVIEGRREIRIDNETKVIAFSGVVRRYDVAADNTIQSELVAEARVSYVGAGDLTTATNREGLGGWIHRAFAWIWPF